MKAEALLTAEREIAKILKQLELDTDAVVETIELCDIDVTGIRHDRRQLSRQVVIELKRNPGTCWNV